MMSGLLWTRDMQLYVHGVVVLQAWPKLATILLLCRTKLNMEQIWDQMILLVSQLLVDGTPKKMSSLVDFLTWIYEKTTVVKYQVLPHTNNIIIKMFRTTDFKRRTIVCFNLKLHLKLDYEQCYLFMQFQFKIIIFFLISIRIP